MFVSEILSESEKYDIVWNGQQGANKRFNIVSDRGAIIVNQIPVQHKTPN